jgi:hypothetical protein
MTPRERAVWLLLVAILVGLLFGNGGTATVDQQSAPVNAVLGYQG